MDDQSLDSLLRQRRDSFQASLPATFQQNVAREIRSRRGSTASALPEVIGWQWLLRPQLVTALLALAMLIGIGLGSRQDGRTAVGTEQALHLEVFGATAPSLPSTLLSANL